MYLTKDVKVALTKLGMLGLIVGLGGYFSNQPPAILSMFVDMTWLPIFSSLGAAALSFKFNQQRILNATLYLLTCQVVLLLKPSLLFTDVYQTSLNTGLAIALTVILRTEDRSVTVKGVIDAFLLLAFATVLAMIVDVACKHFLGDGQLFVRLVVCTTIITVCIYSLMVKPSNNNFLIALMMIIHSLLAYNGLVAHNLTITFLASLCFCLQIADSHNLAYIDELTGIKGRRGLSMDASNLRGPYTVAMADIDHFKKFNDTYGHDVGDQVLKMVANKFAHVRNGRAYRYGGEEFTLLFPGKSSDEAGEYLEEVRKIIEEYPFRIRNKKDRKFSTHEDRSETLDTTVEIVKVTVSIGATSPAVQHEDFTKVQKRADELLYQAKENGRNQVVVKESKLVSE